VFLAVCFLHFWKLGKAPRGFYVDEASVAYNAYCVAKTGADEYGVKYPLFFRCLDNYQDPVLIYCLVPLVKVFGLNSAVVRLPSAIFHILAALAFAFLVQEYCRNKWLALWGGALFALTPWVFPASRLVFSDTAMLLGMVLGWWLLLMALRKGSYGLAAGAGIAWAFAMYARALGRPMSVLLLLCIGLAFHRLLLARWKIGLFFLLSYAAALLPMMVSALRFPQSLTTRFERVSVLQGNPSVNAMMHSVIPRYLEYFSPRFLIFTGDPELRHHTGLGGELFWFTIPLILTGMYHMVRHFRTQPYYRVLALSLLVYPAVAALTNERMHSGRTISGVISWLLVAMVGARVWWHFRRGGRTLLIVICAAGVVEGAAYFADYFGPYQTRCQTAFGTAFTDSLRYCFERIHSNETLYVSGSVGTVCSESLDTDFKPFAYACLLFYGKIDPSTYQHVGFSNTVVRPYLEQIDQPGLLLRCNYTRTNTVTSESTQIAAIPNPESIPDAAKLLVAFQDGTLVFQVWKVGTIPQGGMTHNNPGVAVKHVGTFGYPHSARTHYNLGVTLERINGRIQEAIEQYEEALRLNPDYAEAHYNLGNIFFKEGKVSDAIGHYEQALRTNPDYAMAHNNLGIALAQTGKIEEAIAHYEQAVRIKPDYAEAHCNLGIALAQAGKVEDAIPHFEQALRIKPDYAKAHDNLGVALARLDRLQEAVGHWEQALRIKPDYAEAHYNLGIALEKAGRVTEAIQHYEQALKINPDFIPAQNALARLQTRQ
jgi:tetratricopeptide (TPR) repeat protein